MLHRSSITPLTGAFALALLTLACTEKKPAESAAAAADTAAPAATAAPVPPPELTSRSAAVIASWNQEEPAAVAAFFTDSAVAVIDDSTYTGRAAIRDRWVKPGLPVVSDLVTSDQTFTGSATAMTETGKFRETVTLPKKAPAPNTGTYTAEWTSVGGSWMIRHLTVHNERTPT